MRRVIGLACLLAVPSFTWASPPDPAYQPNLDAAEAEMHKLCLNNAKVVLDLQSFDAESIRNEHGIVFNPTASCLYAIRALNKICQNALEKFGPFEGGNIDAVPTMELTEVRCTLDTKHENAVREWRKDRRDPNAPGDPPKKIFSDLRNPNSPSLKSEFALPVSTWSGSKLTIGLMAGTMNDDLAIEDAARVEAAARAAKPGYEKQRQAVLDRLRKAKADAEPKVQSLADDNAGAVRKAEKAFKEALEKTVGTCKFPLTGTVDWSSLQAKIVPDCTQPPCSAEDKIVYFGSMCANALSGIEEACKDDDLWPQMKKKLKSFSCTFDANSKGEASGSFKRELKGSALEVRMDWDAANQWSDVSAFLKRKL